MPDASPTWKRDATLLAVVLIWGFNFPIIKAALAVMHPHVMNALRLTCSGLVLGGLYVSEKRRRGQGLLAPLRDYGWQVLTLGFLGYFIYQWLFIVGIDHTAAGSAALIMASAPLWTALVGQLFGLERLPRMAWLGLAFTLAGTALIVLFSDRTLAFGGDVLFGNLVMVGAALAWGAYTAFNRPVLRHVSALDLSFLGLVVSLPFLYGLALPHFADVDWAAVNGWVWVAILFSGGLSTGLATMLWSAAVHAGGASNTAAYGNLVPFVALFSSFLFLGETILPMQIVGGVLIIGGIVTMRRVRRREERMPTGA